jgi:hypothetical protein
MAHLSLYHLSAVHSDYFQRLEALVALRSWREDPDITCKYLEVLNNQFSCGVERSEGDPLTRA